MGVVVIDRRLSPQEDKFGTDRQRFLQRHSDIVREAVHRQVAEGGMRDFDKDGVVVPLPPNTILEPTIRHGNGGSSNRVFPGLMKYEVGDRIPKPKGGGGQGGGNNPGQGDPSQEGDGEDDYIWLSPEELLGILFEGRSLPDMTKFKAPAVNIVDREHAGYTNKGPAQKLDMDRTNRKRAHDALVLNKMGEKRVIENLTEQYNILAAYKPGVDPLDLSDKNKDEKFDSALHTIESLKKLFSLRAENEDAAKADKKKTIIPFLFDAVHILKENIDLATIQEDDTHRLDVLEKRLDEQIKSRNSADRYRPDHLTYKYDDDLPKPAAKAVLICKMDVSYSMVQERKNAAKSFFWLMNQFLTTKYKDVDIVFISHTTVAQEVDEETFFYGTESGGTIVSTCIEKAKEVIAERYPPSEWNIYGVQASDGENDSADNAKVTALLREILPVFQAYYYIQVGEPSPYFGKPLYPIYEALAEEFPGRVHTAKITSPAHALEAFKRFFPTGGPTPQSSAYTASP